MNTPEEGVTSNAHTLTTGIQQERHFVDLSPPPLSQSSAGV